MTRTQLAIDGGAPLRSQPFGPKWIFGEEERRHLMEVMDNATTGWRSGFKVRAFADAFATLHGAKYAVATTSGTGAIHSAVAAVNPEPGDEIITTPTTDIGSVLGILLHNAIPVFADWDPETFNTDPADIEHRITERTRAILAVHLYGNPCDMGPILEIARAHDLPVIEDCSQAHLAEYRGEKVGLLGDIGCFSLGGKTLTTDQGGMIITNDEALARRAMGFSRKGSEMDSALRSSLAPTSFRRGGNQGYAFLGDFHPMTDLHAAVGLAQLDRWEEATRVRRQTAAILDEVVPHLPGFKIQKVHPDDRSAYYVYAYTVDAAEAGASSERFAEAVRAEGIPDCYGPYIQGRPLYRYPIFAEEDTYGQSRYPFVDEQGQHRIDYNTLHLPHIERELPKTGFILFRNSYTEQDAKDIAAALRKVALHYSQQAADRNKRTAMAAERFDNQDGSTLIVVPAGDFHMGTDDADAQRMAQEYGWKVDRFHDERPQHTVHLDAFYISEYQVTVEQYDRFLRETGAPPPDCWDDLRFNAPRQPVVGVSRYDAVAYAEWAGLRLPTEAEWEKAARGPEGWRWPWGDEWDPQRVNARQAGADWAHAGPTPVDHFTAGGNVSPYGVCDMVGNVWEWCRDRYVADYYAHSPRTNPVCTRPVVHYDGYDVLRGGSWYNGTERVRCAARYDRFAQMRRRHVGFRCARDG